MDTKILERLEIKLDDLSDQIAETEALIRRQDELLRSVKHQITPGKKPKLNLTQKFMIVTLTLAIIALVTFILG